MNNGLFKNSKEDFEPSEIRLGNESPANGWVLGGTYSLAYGNKKYVNNPGQRQTIGISSNTVDSSILLHSVAYGNGLWVAVGNSSAVRTSTDTITWVSRDALFGGNAIFSVAYGNNVWVAAGGSGQLRTSTDGITWVTQTSAFGTSGIQSVAYGNGLWVAVGNAGQIRTSTDAVTWTPRTSTFTTTINSVAYGNGLWVAVSFGGRVSTSTDGITWSATQTPVSTSNNLLAVGYGNGKWLIGGGLNGGSVGTMRISTNAIDWDVVVPPFSEKAEQFVYANGIWKLVAANSGNTSSVYTSKDGITWTTDFNATATDLLSIAYGNSTWVAVGEPSAGTYENAIIAFRTNYLPEHTPNNLSALNPTTVGTSGPADGFLVANPLPRIYTRYKA